MVDRGGGELVARSGLDEDPVVDPVGHLRRQRGVEANHAVEVGPGASAEVEGARAWGHGLDPVVLGHPLDGHLPVLWDLRNGDGLAAVVDEDGIQGGA